MNMAGISAGPAVMAANTVLPQSQTAQGNGHHTQGPAAPTDTSTIDVTQQQQQQQQQQSAVPTGPNNCVTPQTNYFVSSPTSQLPTIPETKFTATINTAGTQQAILPHMAQNGYSQAANQQASAYSQQNVTGSTSQNANSSNLEGTGSVPGNGAPASGTWTGSSTLTYTQAMQPPDPRSISGGYCKYFFVILCLAFCFLSADLS